MPACQDLGAKDAQDLRNKRNSDQWIKQCNSDHMESCYLLGDLYSHAQGFDAKRRESSALYMKSCRGGFDSACQTFGFATRAAFLENERREQEIQIEEERIMMLAQACRAGQHHKCLEAAQNYSMSKLIKRDEPRIFLLYKQACDGGELDGCMEVASRYMDGRGVALDQMQAITSYRRACDGGKLAACITLAQLYDEGFVVSKNLTEATEFYQKACALGANVEICERGEKLKLVLSISADQIKRQIIKDSIGSYDGPCPCPYNNMRNGRSCGNFSAWSRPGGDSPICYSDDITDDMVDSYREGLLMR